MQPTIEYLERAPAQANLTIDSPDALPAELKSHTISS